MPVDDELKGVRDPAALALFKSLGLDAKTAANAVANPKVTANLTNVVHEVCFFVFVSDIFPDSPLSVVVMTLVLPA